MIGTDSMGIAILAGGAGTRMGGDKPRAMLGGVSLIERAFRHADRWTGETVVVLRSVDQFEAGRPAIVDVPGIDGPLAGLAAGLAWARSQGRTALLTIACDMPFLPVDLPARLGRAIGSRAAAIASSGGHLHPVCGLWRTDALDAIAAYCDAGQRSLKGFAASIGYAEVSWPAKPLDPFFNINSRRDLARAERLIESLEGEQFDRLPGGGGRGPGATPDQQV